MSTNTSKGNFQQIYNAPYYANICRLITLPNPYSFMLLHDLPNE